MDHATKASFWKKLRKTKSTTFSAVGEPPSLSSHKLEADVPIQCQPPSKDGQSTGWLAALAESELDIGSPQLAEPPRRASIYSLQRNPTSEDLPTLTRPTVSSTMPPTSQTLPTRTPSSFDMLFSRSSSSNRSKYAFTPPLQRSDTDHSMNPRSLFEIRAFANALQRLHSKDDSEAGVDSKDERERKRRTLKSARMRPTTSASTTDSGPFKSITRYPLTPYPERVSSLWGLWDHREPSTVEVAADGSSASSPTSSTSAWPSSTNTSATSVRLGDGASLITATAKWHASTTTAKSPLMVNIKSSTGQSMRGECDVLASTPIHELFVPLNVTGKDGTVQEGDFARDIHQRLKEIMGIDPAI